MKKTALVLLGLLGAPLAVADNCPDATCLILDKVAFQVSARQWVSTDTALLSVSANVALSHPDVVQVRADIMKKLANIAAGDWHVTQFERREDNSGLEKLFVMAEARIPQANLTGIYQKAKDNSKPGLTINISGVEFKPGLEEFQKIKTSLRERLYQQVTEELSRLNKVYPNQQYTLNSLSFMEGEGEPQFKAKQMNVMTAAATPAPAADMSVSNEIVMTAVVEVASNRSREKA